MPSSLTKPFTDHPAKVGETYFEHFRIAASFAMLLLMAGAAAVIHALVPALCETTASDIIKRLHAKMSARH